nr:hypothetical protein [uncultured Undibacterium sp.]
MFIKLILKLLTILLISQLLAKDVNGKIQNEEYCIVPVINQPDDSWMATRNFFHIYPVAPHVLINGRFGFLWTIKNFNEAVNVEAIQLTYFYDSVYLDKTKSILIYDPTSHAKAIRVNGYEFVEFEMAHDTANKKYLEELRLSQIRKREIQIILSDKLRVVALNTGIYLNYSPLRIEPILGNQLVDPSVGVEFYMMQGRGDILASAKNGLFIVTKSQSKTASYCSQVKPKKSEKYELGVVRDLKLFNDVKRAFNAKWLEKIVIANNVGKSKAISLNHRDIDGRALNLGETALIEDRRQGRLIRWTLNGKSEIDFQGMESWKHMQIRHMHRLNAQKKDTLVFLNQSEMAYLVDGEGNAVIYKQFPWSSTSAIEEFFSDGEYLYFIAEDKIYKWSERTGYESTIQFDRKKLGRIQQFLRFNKQIALTTDNGIFTIQGSKVIPHFFADQYRTGRIHGVQVNNKNTAYLVKANLGLFIVESDGKVSQLQSPHGIDINLSGEMIEIEDQIFVRNGDIIYRVEDARKK